MRAVLRRIRRSDDAGITLVEMIVVMAISALILGLVGSLLVQVARVGKNSNDRARSTAVAANIMDTITTDVRAGTNIPATTVWAVRPQSEFAISGEQLRLITYSDVARPNPIGMPLQVSYALQSGNLVRAVWTAPASAASYPLSTTPTNLRIVGSKVTAMSISYQQSACTSPKPSPCTVTVVDATNAPFIVAVNVSITVVADNSSTPVTMTSTITMPNAGSTQKYAGS
jgi:prepilin-type N-terminal cleavage/methylation domain-containing protein